MKNGMTTRTLQKSQARHQAAQVVRKSGVTDETWEDLGETIRKQAMAMIDQLASDGDPSSVLRGLFGGATNQGACDSE